MSEPGVPETGHFGGRFQNGDRIRLRKTGETAYFVRYQKLEGNWWAGRRDPDQWMASVQYVNGDGDLAYLDDIEPIAATT